MKFIADIKIMPLEELLDPQGKAVHSGLNNLGLNQVQDVRIGKHIRLQLEAKNKEEAKQVTESACQQLLVNQVMETYSFSLEEA